MVRGLDKVDQLLTLNMAAYNFHATAWLGTTAPAGRPMSANAVALAAPSRLIALATSPNGPSQANQHTG
jgi:hypothetical protein